MSARGQTKWLDELADRVQTVVSAPPPRHVLARVAAVLHSTPIRYVDSDLRGDEHGLTGRFCVFTDTLLAVIDLDKVLPDYADAGPAMPTGSVVVEFLRRATLSRLTIAADGESAANSPDAWDRGESAQDWPSYCGAIDLHYPGLPVLVTVPQHQREPFGPFLPSLVTDLQAP